MPKVMAPEFSRTIEPQSAVGGWMPSPRKLSAAINKKTKQNRRPNSATSGGMALGRISWRMIHQRPSPLSRAASTYSITSMSMATARDRRYTRVESSRAITTTSAGIDVPTTDSTIRAKIRVGNAIRISTKRLISWSTQPPTVAARKPQTIPTTKESAVIRKAMAMVLRAPYSRRENRSRPRLSVPIQ